MADEEPVDNEPLLVSDEGGAWDDIEVQAHEAAATTVQQLIAQAHADKTGSAKAKALLADWTGAKGRFWQIVLPEEKNTTASCQR